VKAIDIQCVPLAAGDGNAVRDRRGASGRGPAGCESIDFGPWLTSGTTNPRSGSVEAIRRRGPDTSVRQLLLRSEVLVELGMGAAVLDETEPQPIALSSRLPLEEARRRHPERPWAAFESRRRATIRYLAPIVGRWSSPATLKRPLSRGGGDSLRTCHGRSTSRSNPR
jgi:hypothetical protein